MLGSNLKTRIAQFALGASDNIRKGLRDSLNVHNGLDYTAKLHNGKRVILLSLAGFPPSKLEKLTKLDKHLTYCAGLGDNEPLRIGFGRNRTVLIEIPKTKELRNNVYIEDLDIPNSPYVIPIGLDTRDKQVNLDFYHPMSAHVLLSGQTRSGKTTSQQYMAHSLMEDNDPKTGMIMFDVAKKGLNFGAFNNHPNLATPVIVDNEQATQAMQYLRYMIDTKDVPYEKIFIFVDELRFLIKDINNSLETLSRIAALGGQYGIHLVVATQYPQKQLLGKEAGELVDNLTIKLCGKVVNAAASSNALGLPDMGAEKLTGFGEFIMVSHEDPCRLVFPMFDPKEIESYPDREYSTLPTMEDDQGQTKEVLSLAQSNQTISYKIHKSPGRPTKPLDELPIFQTAMNHLIANDGDLSQTKFRKLVLAETGQKIDFPQAKDYLAKTKDYLRRAWLDHNVRFQVSKGA